MLRDRKPKNACGMKAIHQAGPVPSLGVFRARELDH